MLDMFFAIYCFDFSVTLFYILYVLCAVKPLKWGYKMFETFMEMPGLKMFCVHASDLCRAANSVCGPDNIPAFLVVDCIKSD